MLDSHCSSNLFNAGRVSLNVERTRAAYQEKVALYQALLLKVFQEVETALAGLRLMNQPGATSAAGRGKRRPDGSADDPSAFSRA